VTATAGLILAAGLGRRFGGRKLLADLGGRPILQHPLDLAAAAGLDPIVVVLGSDAADLEAACTWRGETRIVNPRPEEGMSSSVRLGVARLAETDARRTLVLLGDQPRLALEQVQVLLGAAEDPARPIIVPLYGGVPGNPVLLERAAWPLAAELTGDSGMSQLFRSRPDLVRYVDVPGSNPDVDTPEDLGALKSRS
jgi:molybdenum cofactor cytidylyltransferase